jgi:hypothetical protein
MYVVAFRIIADAKAESIRLWKCTKGFRPRLSRIAQSSSPKATFLWTRSDRTLVAYSRFHTFGIAGWGSSPEIVAHGPLCLSMVRFSEICYASMWVQRGSEGGREGKSNWTKYLFCRARLIKLTQWALGRSSRPPRRS